MLKTKTERRSTAMFLGLIAAVAMASLAEAQNERFLVQCPAPYDSVVAAVTALGGEVTYQYKNIGAVAVTIPAARRSELLSMPGIEAVYKDRLVDAPEPMELAEVPASEIRGVIQGQELRDALEDLPGGYLFNLDLTGASALHDDGIDGSGVLVVVIDSGTANNPSIVPSIAGKVIGGENFVPASEDSVQSATSTNNDPHGTWVGSTIAADIGFLFSNAATLSQSLLTHAPDSVIPDFLPGLSLVPMVGTAPGADLYAMKVFPSNGGGAPESRIIAAMDRAITLRRNFDNGMPFAPASGSGTEDDPFVFDSAPIEVVNMSLGGPTLFAGRDLEDSLTRAMVDAGIVLVASAGNDGHAAMTGGSPGTGKGSLTSGAASLTQNERVLRDLQFGLGIGSLYRPADHHQMATFSSRGPTADGRLDPETSASGFAVFAQGANGGLFVVSGTSFSAPNTSGGAALLRQADPGASAKRIRDALVESSNSSLIVGAGRIDQGRGFVDFPAARETLGKLDDDGDSDSDSDSDSDDVSSRVSTNIAGAGFVTRNGRFSTHLSDLIPGQVMQFFFNSSKDTDRLTIRLENVVPALPPADQNAFFGDDIFLEVVDAPTSFDILRVSAFVVPPGAAFQVNNPQTGIVRVAVMGDWTNAGKISADLTIEEARSPQGKRTARGEVAQGEVDSALVDVPGGAAEVVFELSWEEHWGRYPTDDIDLLLIDPNGNVSVAGATLNSPERVVITNPAGGVWTAEISGFTVHGDGDDDDDSDDDDGGTSKWELRATADGKRLMGLK